MKKRIVIAFIISIILQVGCSNFQDSNNEINDEMMKVEEITGEETIDEKTSEEYTSFTALDNIYTKGEDISKLNTGQELFNNIEGGNYIIEKYIEADFACDVIDEYLLGNGQVFNSLITLDETLEDGFIECTDEEKVRLNNGLISLRAQMGVNDDSPIYFRISKAIYEGKAEGIEKSAVIKVIGHLSSDNINFVSLSKFIVTIVYDKDKLLANIV